MALEFYVEVAAFLFGFFKGIFFEGGFGPCAVGGDFVCILADGFEGGLEVYDVLCGLVAHLVEVDLFGVDEFCPCECAFADDLGFLVF